MLKYLARQYSTNTQYNLRVRKKKDFFNRKDLLFEFNPSTNATAHCLALEPINC